MFHFAHGRRVTNPPHPLRVARMTGYKDPPKHSQFKKGQIANPKGRPKGVTNMKTDIDAEFAELVELREGGKSRRVSKRRALIKKMFALAMGGNVRAADMLLNRHERHHADDPAMPEDTNLSPEEQAILAAFLKRNPVKEGNR